MPRSLQPFTIEKFLGLNNVDDPVRLEKGELAKAQNVDIDNKFKVKRRKGYTKQVSGSDVHSLWSDGNTGYFVDGNTLKKLTKNGATYSASNLRTDMVTGAAVSYASVNGEVYYSNGDVIGRVVNGSDKSWEVETPAAAPNLSSTAGNLPEGRYQVTITFVDSDGRESAAPDTKIIDLSADKAIVVSGMPTGKAKRVYCTPQNGTSQELYLAKEVSSGTSSTTLFTANNSIPLMTYGLSAPPIGAPIAYTTGRIFVVVDNYVFFSRPMMPHLFRLRKDYFAFAEDINLLVPVVDGVFISSDKTYFVSMTQENPPLVTVADYKAIEGTEAFIDGTHLLKGDQPGIFAVWASEEGFCIGGPGGQFQNLTTNKVHPGIAASGATIIRRENGVTQIIAALKNTSNQGNIRVSDTVEAEVIRNGVSI